MTNNNNSKKRQPKGINISKTLRIYFIPHEDNNHRPFIIRARALKFYSIVLILTKIIVTGFLYLSYPSAGFFSSATTANIVSLTNSSRQENNLASLNTSETLNRAAFQKAQDMVANNYFSHDSPSGSKFWNWILGAGYQYSSAGENLAMDFTSAESVITALMGSASHRKNILNPNFTEIGVSVLSGKINNKDTMILVQMFGTPKAQAAPPPAVEETPPISSPEPPPEETVEPETTPPSEPPVVQPPVTTPSPVYKAELVSLREESLGIKTGEEISFWADIKNTGNTTWVNSGENFVALNTTDPAGRESSFQHSSWLETYRPTKLRDNISPTETARFEFMLKAPKKAGAYKEAFQLVAENLTWIEGSYFEVPITVVEAVIVNANVNITPAVNQNINVNTNKETGIAAISNTNDSTPKGIAEGETIPTIASAQEIKKTRSFTDYLISYSQIIFWAIIVLVGVSLLINTFIKIRIQHASTVIPSLLVILLATLMLIFRFHFIENILSQPIIL